MLKAWLIIANLDCYHRWSIVCRHAVISGLVLAEAAIHRFLSLLPSTALSIPEPDLVALIDAVNHFCFLALQMQIFTNRFATISENGRFLTVASSRSHPTISSRWSRHPSGPHSSIWAACRLHGQSSVALMKNQENISLR